MTTNLLTPEAGERLQRFAAGDVGCGPDSCDEWLWQRDEWLWQRPLDHPSPSLSSAQADTSVRADVGVHSRGLNVQVEVGRPGVFDLGITRV